ncbi:MAG: DUF2267 domain-containing protein [Bacillota bacterium]|nr:DUF2267 domain-containing protein [Bacillota bacterium]
MTDAAGGIDRAELYRHVRRAAALGSDQEAASVVRAVLRSLGQVLPRESRALLEGRLPGELSAEMERFAPPEPDPLLDRELFLGRLTNGLQTEGLYDQTLGGLDLVSSHVDEDAIRQIRAVFGALQAGLPPETRGRLAAELPPEVADWWRDPA